MSQNNAKNAKIIVNIVSMMKIKNIIVTTIVKKMKDITIIQEFAVHVKKTVPQEFAIGMKPIIMFAKDNNVNVMKLSMHHALHVNTV